MWEVRKTVKDPEFPFVVGTCNPYGTYLDAAKFKDLPSATEYAEFLNKQAGE